MRRTTILDRLSTLACAVLFVWANGASNAHMLAVAHAVCPEHGEIVHVPSSTSCATADEHHHSEHSGGAHPAELAPAHAEDSHDTCCFGAPARPTTPSAKLFVAPGRLVDSRPSRPVVELPHGEPFARILLAPKHSPPRRANFA